jgi:hypothetical protein
MQSISLQIRFVPVLPPQIEVDQDAHCVFFFTMGPAERRNVLYSGRSRIRSRHQMD